MAENNVQESAAEPAAEGERERSTISFPYNDLDNGVRVAKAVHQVGGTSCQREQLAAELKVSANGGGFNLLLLTAKIFGLVTYGQGSVHLTQLGSKISDTKQEKEARAAAFLTVPLYKAVYDRYKGNALPPATALENEMAALGVAKKQTDKARQTFQRSAAQAGFFWAGNDRLVMPKGTTGGAAATADPPADDQAHDDDEGKDDQVSRNRNNGGNGGGRHPFIQGLLKELPNEGSDWGTADRVKWLKAAAMIFDLIYKNEDSGKPLKIEVSSDSAK